MKPAKAGQLCIFRRRNCREAKARQRLFTTRSCNRNLNCAALEGEDGSAFFALGKNILTLRKATIFFFTPEVARYCPTSNFLAEDFFSAIRTSRGFRTHTLCIEGLMYPKRLSFKTALVGFGCWAQSCAANASSRSALNLCLILSSDSPTNAPEGLNTHVHSEQPKPTNFWLSIQTSRGGIAALKLAEFELDVQTQPS